ncbi:MAG: molybdopterin-dependent oxidoreductase [Candidatus Bathyarchaeota archaeon]|nr:MAG: molybdopterin-dependent oxidoreductase [Candidatus Bathyarchaeota archaeon]
MRRIKSVCPRDCPDSCFLTVTVEDERVASVKGDGDHPLTQGFTCPRGASDPERVYSPERVLYPHARDRDAQSFKRVTWDEALTLVSLRLREVIDEQGPGAVLHLDYAGNTGLLSYDFFRRLWNAIGATGHDSSICSSSGHAALALHYGLSYGLQPEELPGMRAVTFWGFNPVVSAPHIWRLAQRAREENGASIITVDPRLSESARSGGLWLNPRPGSDVALAYGIARCLIEAEAVDLAFIEEWTQGFDAYRDEAMRWTPERVEELTAVEWGRIEALAALYAESSPSAFMIGLGLQKSLYGAEAVRAVSLIPALLGLHRGFYYSNSRGRFVDYEYVSGEKLTGANRDIVSQVSLGKLLDAGRFGFVYVNGMNPAVTLPEQGAVRRGLAREDVFVVVHDTHWTETTRLADVVLPAPTYLEKDDLVVADSHPYVRRSVGVVEPLGESRDEVSVMLDLARGLGVEEGWVYEDPWEALTRAFEGAFEDGAVGDLAGGATLRLRSKPRDSYQTPTERVEFYPESAIKIGASPLPVQLPLNRSGDDYVFLTSALPRYTHSQFRDVHGPIPSTVWLSAQDAGRLGFGDGDIIEIHNYYGSLLAKAKVTPRTPPGVLWSPRLFTDLRGEPQNTVFPPETQAIGGGPLFNSTLVRIGRGYSRPPP